MQKLKYHDNEVWSFDQDTNNINELLVTFDFIIGHFDRSCIYSYTISQFKNLCFKFIWIKFWVSLMHTLKVISHFSLHKKKIKLDAHSMGQQILLLDFLFLSFLENLMMITYFF